MLDRPRPQTTNLSAYVQKQLVQQLDRMHQMAQAAMTAMDEEGRIYEHSGRAGITTITNIMILQKVAREWGMPSETMAFLDELIQEYMADISDIPHEACSQMLEVLQSIPAEPDGWGLVDELRSALVLRLRG